MERWIDKMREHRLMGMMTQLMIIPHNNLILWSKPIKLKKEISKIKKKLSNIYFTILGALFLKS